ncbi:MAG TPA: class I SAM-dependent methyltransferase [Mycobacteriales bacterium]|nr:class I SAM-dependent methyltransferase [Mycobacteriales bacterium]
MQADPAAVGAPAAPSPLPLVATVLALAGVRRGATVLDVLAGSGLSTRAAAAAAADGGTVIALESDPALLAVGRARSAQPGWAPISWLHAGSAAVPLRAGSVDTVLCAPVPPRSFALDQALPQLQRVIRVGGRVVVGGTTGSASQAASQLCAHGFSLAHLEEASWSGNPVWYLVGRRG